MDEIREYLNRPSIAGAVGLVVGAIIGLVVLGWGLFPVEYENAFPEHLRADYREDYLRMAIESYGQSLDAATARERFSGLGANASTYLDAIAANPGSTNAAAITQFGLAVQGEKPAGESTEGEEAATGTSLVRGPLLIMCGLTLVLAAVLVGAFVLRRQQDSTQDSGLVQDVTQEMREMADAGDEPPLAQFMTTYMVGDDLFDDSFSVDSPAGEFLGECGIGIAETIGVGEPKRVSSFEVWLFDKNDIQTVTKVLMSTHVFGDEATRQRLAAKGEPMLAEPGSQLVLETATLQLVARVVDLSYGEGALPPESFFERLTLELAVWPKG